MSNDENKTNPNPAAQPPRQPAVGLPRMVLETRTRLGPTVTPEQVTQELQSKGVQTTLEDVRSVWDEGHAGD
jgi:hypothetical protein